MPRNIFDTPNVPEAESERRRREVDNFRGIKDNMGYYLIRDGITTREDLNAARESFLARVDFEKLREILAGIYRKCGLTEETMNFVGPERVILGEPDNAGLYNPDMNNIDIFPYNIKISETMEPHKKQWLAKKIAHVEDVFGSSEVFMLTVLIHEEAHAVSRNICIGVGKGDEQNPLYEQSGFARHVDYRSSAWKQENIPMFQGRAIAEKKSSRQKKIFGTLNEGIVERLAGSIVNEYLEQTGWGKEEVVTYKENRKNHPELLAYPEEVKLVDLIIPKIAKLTGVSEETVSQALVRGLMEGETFADEEVQQLFAQAFGDDFLEKLSGAWRGKDKKLMIGTYDQAIPLEDYLRQSEVNFTKEIGTK